MTSLIKKCLLYTKNLILLFVCNIFWMLHASAQTGREIAYLTARAGKWDVVMHIATSPDSNPQTIEGIVAERTLVNDYILREVMHPSPGSARPDFKG